MMYATCNQTGTTQVLPLPLLEDSERTDLLLILTALMNPGLVISIEGA